MKEARPSAADHAELLREIADHRVGTQSKVARERKRANPKPEVKVSAAELLHCGHCAELHRRLAEADAKVEACRRFLETEMGWEYFRAEMLHFDDKPKASASEENARKLRNFLAGAGQ